MVSRELLQAVCFQISRVQKSSATVFPGIRALDPFGIRADLHMPAWISEPLHSKTFAANLHARTPGT